MINLSCPWIYFDETDLLCVGIQDKVKAKQAGELKMLNDGTCGSNHSFSFDLAYRSRQPEGTPSSYNFHCYRSQNFSAQAGYGTIGKVAGYVGLDADARKGKASKREKRLDVAIEHQRFQTPQRAFAETHPQKAECDP